MWCFHCEQVVELQPTDGGGVCARCAREPNRDSADFASLVPSAAFVEVDSDGPASWNDGTAEMELARIEAILKAGGPQRSPSPQITSGPLASFERSFSPPPVAVGRSVAARPPRPGIWAWTVMLLGVMGLSCGAVLVGCSFLPGRGALWNVGLPVLLAGQVVLLFGLLLQIERVWHNSRWAGRRLEDVDQRIDELNRSAALWTTTASPPATAFYHHLAHGASPHILLADLKGQMDLLAQRAAQSR